MSEYPTAKELKAIREFKRDDFDYLPLMELVKASWWMPDWGFNRKGRTFWLSTGGWSGNESIIDALEKNQMFWITSYWSHRRGGHFVFKVPKFNKAGVEVSGPAVALKKKMEAQHGDK